MAPAGVAAWRTGFAPETKFGDSQLVYWGSRTKNPTKRNQRVHTLTTQHCTHEASGRTRRLRLAHAGIALGLLAPSNAYAYDEPNLNLGLTSFLDGAPPAGPGWYATQYVQAYSAGTLTNAQGNNLGLPKEDVSVLVGITQLTYLSPVKVGPGSFGVNFLLPYVLGANVNDGLGGAVLKGNTGLGDVTFGPFYQFDPIMGPNGPIFVARIEAQIIAPIGDYSSAAAVNPGSNYWSFDPYISGTYFFSPQWTASVRLHYLWNGENDDPAASYGAGALTTQAGQAVHANFATEYAVTDQLRLGVNGYWLQQTTNTQVNGVGVPGTKERVWALGPGALYGFDKSNFMFVNAYYEFAAQNRPEGQKYVFRFVHHFD